MAKQGLPNIVLIVVDSLRADHLSCYGYRRHTTPNLDRLAADGVLFEWAISPAAWTLPSLASLFTGTYPSQHQTYDRHPHLPSSLVTLAGYLRSCGYQTVGFSNNGWISHATGLSNGFEVFVEGWFSAKRSRLEQAGVIATRLWERLVGKYDNGARSTNQRVQRWLTADREVQRPFFLFLHYQEPHFPYDAPYPYKTYYLPTGTQPPKGINISATRLDYLAGKVQISSHDFRLLTDLYDGEILYVDSKIGEIVKLLDCENLLQDAILIVVADHGENIGDHGLMGHQYCVYDSLIHVPIIIHYPLSLESGRRISGLVQPVDIFPTLISLLNISDEQLAMQVEAARVLPLSKCVEPRSFAVAEELRPNLGNLLARQPVTDVTHFDRSLAAIRTRAAKYIQSSDGHDEFYDLRSDPSEKQNLIDDDVNDVTVLRQELAKWRATLRTAYAGEEAPGLDDSVIHHLRGLGYIS